jgi:hypothetical protein
MIWIILLVLSYIASYFMFRYLILKEEIPPENAMIIIWLMPIMNLIVSLTGIFILLNKNSNLFYWFFHIKKNNKW